MDGRGNLYRHTQEKPRSAGERGYRGYWVRSLL